MAMGGGIWPVGLRACRPSAIAGHTCELRFVTPRLSSRRSGSRCARRPRRRRGGHDGDRPIGGGGQRVVRAALLARPGSARTSLHVRLHRARRSSASSATFACAASSRTASRRSTCRTSRCADDMLVGYAPKDLAVRASTPHAELVPAIRAIIHDVDPKQPVDARPAADRNRRAETASRAAQVRVLAAFAGVAFLLAGDRHPRAAVVHGVAAHAGNRRAHGARGGSRQYSVADFASGAAAGRGRARSRLVARLRRRRGLGALLVGVTPGDHLTYAAVVALTLLMAIAGTVLPALRAVRVDPLRAIRQP